MFKPKFYFIIYTIYVLYCILFLETSHIDLFEVVQNV